MYIIKNCVDNFERAHKTRSTSFWDSVPSLLKVLSKRFSFTDVFENRKSKFSKEHVYIERVIDKDIET